jgi:hypothetical protein
MTNIDEKMKGLHETFNRKQQRLQSDIEAWSKLVETENDPFKRLVEKAFRQEAIRMQDIFSLLENAFTATTILKNQIDDTSSIAQEQGKINLEGDVADLKARFDKTFVTLEDVIKKINERDNRESENDRPFYG